MRDSIWIVWSVRGAFTLKGVVEGDMPIEIEKKDGQAVYLCEACGEHFEDKFQAEDHEQYCGPRSSM